ncbi:TPA: hypothetical protein N0F65_006466 [Lagenidium giganteum]|uniref:Crinkler effector protein N-terminal domain-containing protein n=1 Tax=Lagenidium giganteum TaxID=4803 RepID=A0AAV2Z1L8_9STRA|nr:TPA: hypothetical protein N0F65_006466 [Lagenidium giganteum]
MCASQSNCPRESLAETEKTDVKLRCGVYGERSVFSVEIKRDADVEALQEANVNKKKDVNVRFNEMFSWLKLDNEKLFGTTPSLGEENIHVLVKLPDLPNKRLRAEIVPRIEQFKDVPQINIEDVQYVTLPAAFLEKCGYKVPSDLLLYCRSQVRDLWSFVQDEVVAKNGRGFIVGPPGTGKSVSTLSYVASLDHQEWNVVWIHLSNRLDTCLSLGTKEYWEIDDLSSFELPRVAGKKLFICLDGFLATTAHELFFKRVFAHLDKTNERLIVCSSMATLGKRNWEDDHWTNIQVFFMYSWTHDEYVQAIADQTFYDKIVSKLDVKSFNEVNEDDDSEAGWSEEEKKKHALDLKFYYGGGSCRFMFQ